MNRVPQPWLLCLLLLALLGVTVFSNAAFACHDSPLSSFAPFAYDGHSRTTDGYGDNTKLGFAYDASSVLAPGEKKSGATEKYGTLAKFAGFLAAEGTGSLRLNIFGEGEAPGFADVSTSQIFATGGNGVTRPLTTSLPDGSASDIFMRGAPVTGEGTIREIMRLSQPGTRITLMQASGGFQGQALIDAFGENASVDFIRTFPSQTWPSVDVTIMRLTVGGN